MMAYRVKLLLVAIFYKLQTRKNNNNKNCPESEDGSATELVEMSFRDCWLTRRFVLGLQRGSLQMK